MKNYQNPHNPSIINPYDTPAIMHGCNSARERVRNISMRYTV